MSSQIYEHLDYPSALLGIRSRIEDESIKSYEKLADKLNVATRSKMKRMLKGEISMPKEVCDNFCMVAGLQKIETTYIQLLRKIHFSSDVDQMITLTKKIVEIRKTYGKGILHDSLHEAQTEVFSQWYLFPLLYFFSYVKDKSVDAASLSKAFRGQVTPLEAWNGVNKLVELGLLVKTSDNSFKRANKSISLLDGSPRAIIRKFHKMMIGKALETIELPVDARFLTAATMSIKKENFQKLTQRMNEFLAEMITLYSEEDGDSVHQLNMQCFSLMDK